jgi:hypothetical protein
MARSTSSERSRSKKARSGFSATSAASRVLHGVPLVLDDVAFLGRPPVPVDEGVGEDLVEPGLDVGAALELVEEAESPEHRILDQVLGVPGVLGEAESGGVEAVEMRKGQGLELAAAPLCGALERQVPGLL